jgi:hypothetical protein
METWLTESDIERLYRVSIGNLPEYHATLSEILEFNRVIEYNITLKTAGPEYVGATIQ